MKIGFEHQGLENFAFHVDRSSNRVAFALIISSLIIGSSLVIRTHIGPLLFGLPILGLFGFTIALIFLCKIWSPLISILRLGRRERNQKKCQITTLGDRVDLDMTPEKNEC